VGCIHRANLPGVIIFVGFFATELRAQQPLLTIISPNSSGYLQEGLLHHRSFLRPFSTEHWNC
jgi:hypothetical protein